MLVIFALSLPVVAVVVVRRRLVPVIEWCEPVTARRGQPKDDEALLRSLFARGTIDEEGFERFRDSALGNNR